MDRALALVGIGLSLVSLGLYVQLALTAKTSKTDKNRTARPFSLPKSIILIRHGESKGNSQEDTYETTPDPLVPLTKKGRKQCDELGKKLKEKIGSSPVWVYVSPHQSVQIGRLS